MSMRASTPFEPPRRSRPRPSPRLLRCAAQLLLGWAFSGCGGCTVCLRGAR
jgi:hypothetical protein